MLRLSQRLRSCLSTSVSSLLPLPASSPSPPHLHTPSLSPDPAGDARETGIYILGEQREREVELGEALQGLRAYSMAPTPETVAVNVKVNMTLKRNKVRDPFKGPVSLPHTFGQEQIILFVLESSLHDRVLEAGADIVAAEEIFQQLEEDAVNFDICLTTHSWLERFKPLQMKLKSKMPNIRRGTVVSEDSITEAIQQFKTTREFKSDKKGHILVPVGKLDFPDEHITENITSLLRGVASYHGKVPKTSFVQKVLLTTTYGPAFPIRTRHLL